MHTEHATCPRCGHPIYHDSEGEYCPHCGPVLKEYSARPAVSLEAIFDASSARQRGKNHLLTHDELNELIFDCLTPRGPVLKA